MIPQKKTSCHVFKMGIFSKLFVAVMAHIIMENADKKIKLLIICFQLKIVDILLSFFLWASLYIIIFKKYTIVTGTTIDNLTQNLLVSLGRLKS